MAATRRRTSSPSGASRGSRPKRNRARKRRSFLGRLVYRCGVLGVWALMALVGLVAFYAAQLPRIDQLEIPKRPPNIAILADDGSLLVNRGDTGGAAVRIGELPPYLPKAFVSIEDRRFYTHFGIDPMGILRALTRNVTGRGGMQGGSTLTQQLAKNLFLTQERTFSRKIQEAILALWLEHKYSKNQILELYLNRVYFGAGAFGVEAAAQRYFGHNARQVTLAEAAMLAGLMKAPTKLAPNRNPDGATERANQVVAAMAQEGHITETMAQLALANPAHAMANTGGSANYAADYVMDVLDDTIGAIGRRHRRADELVGAPAGGGGQGARRGARQEGRSVRRKPGRARRARSGRRDQGARRRPQLCRKPVRPRGGCEAPAGLLVQALRLPRRARTRPHARQRTRRCADQRPRLAA